MAVELAAGSGHTCARTSTGEVYCWGKNDSGQLGRGSTSGIKSTPQQVKGVGGNGFLSGVVELALGFTHTCARTSAGAVYCWGKNSSGQLGIGIEGDAKGTPQQVKGVGGNGFLSGVVELVAGSEHTCARTSKAAGGAVYCWGKNSFGQLGIGIEGDAKGTPQQVQGVGGNGFLSGVVELAAGWGHTCARTSGGVYCWGSNGSGQLGLGISTIIRFQYKTPQVVFSGGGCAGKPIPKSAGVFSTKLNVLKAHKGPKTGFRCIYQPLCDPALGGSGPGGCSPPFNPPSLSR